jgi:hypothetical protein
MKLMKKKLAFGFVAWLVVAIIYLLSFAPFLRYHPDASSPYYRSATIYRFAEWAILRTPLQSPLLKWSDVVGSLGETQWQVWLYAQGSSDPESEWHFNLQNQ